jgi:UDP-2,3-diacylglucosamine hydrolase
VDLPTIGPATVEAAARAGLAGIVGEAGRLLVLDREAVIALADDLGLFIFGVEPDGS